MASFFFDTNFGLYTSHVIVSHVLLRKPHRFKRILPNDRNCRWFNQSRALDVLRWYINIDAQ
jgi:hypothetical protein